MQPQPVPKPAKNRLLQDGRDMFWSMAPLVLACIVLAGMVGMCSFQARGPQPGAVPSYDAATALKSDAETLGFPIRMPALPQGWQPNSGARSGIETGRTDPATGQQVRAKVSTVGYLTASGKYLSLTQSDADEDRLVATLHPDLAPAGTEDVAGVRWIVYDGGERGEPVWTTRLPGAGSGTQIALTGAGDEGEFRILATATQTASPLPDQPGR
jgi:Protein of unknown function (DUF4245)